MKKLILFLITILFISLLVSADIVIHKTNGETITIDKSEFVNIDFSGEMPTFVQMIASPQNLSWTTNNTPDSLNCNILCTIKDTNGEPVPNQAVVFRGTLGEPADGNWVKYTDENGQIEFEWKFWDYECPMPTPSGCGENTATIWATIDEENFYGQTTLYLYRYVD